MKYGVIHYNNPGNTVEEFLDWASKSGFDCVELQAPDVWPDGDPIPEKTAKEVKALLDKHKLGVSSLSACNDFDFLNEESVQYQVNRMHRIFALAEIIGSKVVRVDGGQIHPGVPEEFRKEAIVHCVKRVLPFAEAKNIKLAMDNHGYITNDGDLLYSILNEVNNPMFGTNLDTMNYRWFGNDIKTCDRYYEMMAPYTFHTHMKDGFGEREKYVGAALGEGEIHLDYAVKLIKKGGYEGPWIAEYEGPEGDGVGYCKCLAWMKENI